MVEVSYLIILMISPPGDKVKTVARWEYFGSGKLPVGGVHVVSVGGVVLAGWSDSSTYTACRPSCQFVDVVGSMVGYARCCMSSKPMVSITVWGEKIGGSCFHGYFSMRAVTAPIIICLACSRFCILGPSTSNIAVSIARSESVSSRTFCTLPISW